MSALTVEILHYNQSGYGQLALRVRHMYESTLSDRLLGCIGNAAGYGGGQETADRIAIETAESMRDGHTKCYDHSFYEGRFTVRFQEYDHEGERNGYCSPSFEDMGDKISELDSSLKLVKRIGAKLARIHGIKAADLHDRHWEDPTMVYQAIEAAGAERIEFCKVGQHSWSGHYVDAIGERIAFRGEEAAEAAA